MTDYSKMSDKEININVAKALGAKQLAQDLWMSDERRFDFDKPKNKSMTKFFFDPCNNPADAWPIIVNSLISVEPDYEFLDEAEEEVFPSGNWISEHTDGRGNFVQHLDKSPLRGAMIVFLMMKDAENAPAI